MAYRWVALLCTIEADRRPPMAPLMRVFFVSTFVGTFLPASVGGDIVRSYRLARLNVDAGDAVASVLMDRMLGVASILLMALAGLALARDLAGNAAIVVGLVAAAGGLRRDAAADLQSDSRGAGRARRVAAAVRAVAPHRREDSSSPSASTPRTRRSCWRCSPARWRCRCCASLQAYCLGRSLGIDAPLAAYFAFVPLILLIMLLPVTINGLGTWQAAFVWFFARAGVSSAAAFACRCSSSRSASSGTCRAPCFTRPAPASRTRVRRRHERVAACSASARSCCST